MTIIGEWIRRLGYLLRRRALEDELRREMEAHRALLEEPRAFGNTLDIFANLAAFSTLFVGLDVGEGTRRTLASAVTANYFDIFGQPLALGRPFTSAEERLDIRVAIVSYSLWERLGADPDMLGRSVRLNGEPFTVIGVAAWGFAGTEHPRTRGVAANHPGRRARRARVDRAGAAPDRHPVRDRRAGSRHRWPSTRASISGDQRRLHARDVHAFASHVLPGSREWRDECDARRAPDDHAGDRPPRRVPQPRQSAARARSRASAGVGHQVVTGWQSMAHHSAIAHRRDAARVGRRRYRAVVVDVGDKVAAGVGRTSFPRRIDPPRIRSRLASTPRDGGVQSAGLAGLQRIASLGG